MIQTILAVAATVAIFRLAYLMVDRGFRLVAGPDISRSWAALYIVGASALVFVGSGAIWS